MLVNEKVLPSADHLAGLMVLKKENEMVHSKATQTAFHWADQKALL